VTLVRDHILIMKYKIKELAIFSDNAHFYLQDNLFKKFF